jgi:ubiquinone/menaquinone biosynthesis C-methylase UbiE
VQFYLIHHRDVIRQFLNPNLASEENQSIFQSEDEVKRFADIEYLRNPELVVLNELRDKIAEIRMLDIGVGGGRTTKFFADLAKEYIGIDYSPLMIEAAKRRFKDYSKKVSFLTLDARDMHLFPTGYFNFVLFSWCGLDYVNHEDRIRILKEIRRVLAPDGFFFFSTHNLNYFKRSCSVRLSCPLREIPWRFSFLLTNRLLNKEVWMMLRDPTKNLQRMVIKEPEPPHYTLKAYMITPREQLTQLEASGFSKIRVLSKEDGIQVQNSESVVSNYMFILCQAN